MEKLAEVIVTSPVQNANVLWIIGQHGKKRPKDFIDCLTRGSIPDNLPNVGETVCKFFVILNKICETCLVDPFGFIFFSLHDFASLVGNIALFCDRAEFVDRVRSMVNYPVVSMEIRPSR